MKNIGVVLFPGFQVMCLAMTTVFEFANLTAGAEHYQVTLLSEQGGPVRSSLGFNVDTVAFRAQPFDTLLVTGDNDGMQHSPSLLALLRDARPVTRRMGSACTGAFALAQAGLLDGVRATTHWHHARAFREAYPLVKLEDDRIFVNDGSVWTSAGMTACIDLALALVENDLGTEIARSVARKLVVFHRRAGGQSQFSVLLELEPKSDRIQSALAWARQNLRAELSVERLADVAHLSPRQFSRAFREETGQSPARAVERLRVEAARLMMEEGRLPVDVIARESGFGDRERMRRAFLRAFGQPPQAIRRAGRVAGHSGMAA